MAKLAQIYLIAFTNCLNATTYSVVAPLLPLELERKGIEGAYVGVIFALYSVGNILWAPVVGK